MSKMDSTDIHDHAQSTMQIDSPSPTTAAVTIPQSTVSAIASVSSPPAISPPNAGSSVTTPKAKLKRNRLTISCLPCHTRKQKCDRNQPCFRCLKRGDSQQCVYSTPRVQQRVTTATSSAQGTRGQTATDEGLTNRVAHLESIVNATYATLSGLGNVSIPGLNTISNTLLQTLSHNTTTPTSSTTQHTQTNVPLPENPVQVAAAALGQLSRQPHTRDPNENQVIDHSSGSVKIMRNLLPQSDVLTDLVCFFFDQSTVPWVHPFLHRPTFNYNLAQFTSEPENPSLFDFGGLLSVVCLLALQYLPGEPLSSQILRDHNADRVSLQKRLLDLSQSILVSLGRIHYSTVERIQGQCLLALYYSNENDLLNCNLFASLAIRNAQLFGLHREVSPGWDIKPRDIEIRRRLWGCIYVLDRSICFDQRQPFLIHEIHCNVPMPTNGDEESLSTGGDLPNLPLSEFTSYSFHICQINIHKIASDVWEQCLNVKVPTYATVISLDENLSGVEWPQELHMQVVGHECTILNYQRVILRLHFCNTRIILLRNCLFKGNGFSQDVDPRVSETEYKLEALHAQAVQICILHCKQVIACYQTLCTLTSATGTYEHLRWSIPAMMVFNSALTLMIAAITRPKLPLCGDLPQWTGLAEELTRSSNHYGARHPNLLPALGVLHRHTTEAIGGTISQPWSGPEDVQKVLMEKAGNLSSATPSGEDQTWASVQATVYSRTFPTMENMNALSEAAFMEFCDSLKL